MLVLDIVFTRPFLVHCSKWMEAFLEVQDPDRLEPRKVYTHRGLG